MPNQRKKPAEQIIDFERAARAIGCDESEARFNAVLGKIARHKPPEEPKKTETKKPGR